MFRRTILTAPLALGACSATGTVDNTSSTIAMVAQDVKLIADAFSKSLTQIQAINPSIASPKVLDTLQLALSGIKSVASAMTNVTTVSDTQSLVSKVSAYAGTFLDAASALPLPSEIKSSIAIASVLLPVVELSVNLAVSRASTVAMTPTQARAALK